MSDTEPQDAGPAPLTLDQWYEMNHHEWQDVVNDFNAMLDFFSWVKKTHPYYYHRLMIAYEGRPKQ